MAVASSGVLARRTDESCEDGGPTKNSTTDDRRRKPRVSLRVSHTDIGAGTFNAQHATQVCLPILPSTCLQNNVVKSATNVEGAGAMAATAGSARSQANIDGNAADLSH